MVEGLFYIIFVALLVAVKKAVLKDARLVLSSFAESSSVRNPIGGFATDLFSILIILLTYIEKNSIFKIKLMTNVLAVVNFGQ